MDRDPDLEPAAIRAALRRLPAVFRGSPQYVHDGLSDRAGVPVIVKVETVNPIRSFKGRGTWTAIGALAADGRIGADRPVVCVSRRELRSGRGLCRPGPRHPGRRVLLDPGQSSQGRADAGLGRAGHRAW